MWLFKKKPHYEFMDIGLTADVHSHILPGVDDGSPDLEHSIDIISKLKELGVRHFTLTPHVSISMFPNTSPDLRERFARFLAQLPEDLARLSYHLGSEYMIDEAFSDIEDHLCYPDGHILIEMSYYERSREIKDAIFNLQMDGLKPILAHPERYVFYQKVFDRKKGVTELNVLRDMGCELQLNVMSLTGAYGERSMGIVKWLLANDMYSYIGTDVHASGQIGHFNSFQISEKEMEKVRQLARKNESLFES